MVRITWLFVAVCGVGLLVGCPSSPPPAGTGSGNGKSTTETSGDSTGKPGPASFDPNDPAAGARNVMTGLTNRKLRALWDFLPSGYQDDLQSLTRQFATKMDPEIWGRVIAIVRRSASILREKEPWLQTPAANTPKAAGGANAAPEPVNYKAVAALLDALADSELGDLDRLKKIDVGAWCDGVGVQLLEQLHQFAERMPNDPLARTMTGVADLELKSRKPKGDEVIIEIIAPRELPVEIPYVKVDGKWIPRDLANGWIEAVGESRARMAVALSEENLAAAKPQILTALGFFDEWLGRLEKAKTKEEFDFAWSQGLQNSMTVLATFSPSLPVDPAMEGTGEEESAIPLAKVVVTAELTFEQQDELLEKLAKLTDEGAGTFREISASNTEVSFTVGPVSDVAAFARKLPGLTVSKVDSEARMIWAAPKGR